MTRGAQSQRQRAEFSDTRGAAAEHCRVRGGPLEPRGPSHWQARVLPPRALLRAADIPTERARHPRTLLRGPFPLLHHRGLQPLQLFVTLLTASSRLCPLRTGGPSAPLAAASSMSRTRLAPKASGSIQARPSWPALSLRGPPVPQPRASPAPRLPGHAEGLHRKAPSPTCPLCQRVVKTSSRLTSTVTPQPGRGRWRRLEAAEAPGLPAALREASVSPKEPSFSRTRAGLV